MQIHFTPEQEEKFRQKVERGIAAAERGELLESAEVWRRVEAVFEADSALPQT